MSLARLSRLCGGLSPCVLDLHDFLVRGWPRRCRQESCGDDLASGLDDHVEVDGFVFDLYQSAPLAALVSVGAGVAV